MLVFFTNLSLMEFQVRYSALFLLFSVIDDFTWFCWMESLHKNIQLMQEFLKAPFLVLHFSYYTLMTFLMMLSVILPSMLMILLSILGAIGLLICGNNLNWLLSGSILEEKSSFKMVGLTFSSKLDWVSYIISIAKTASKKIGALIRSMKFLSPEVAVYLYKSTIRPCVKYCCQVWAGAPSCYLDLFDKLQKQDMQDCWSFTCCFS